MCRKSFLFYIIIALAVMFAGCSATEKEMNPKAQESALAAHSLLLEAYGFDENGYVCYPDNYAGSWVEDDKLVIALTDTSEESVAEYKIWAGEYAEVLQFVQAEYSYNYLCSKMEEIVNDAMEKHDIEIIDYGVSQEENEIIITVDWSDYLTMLWVSYDVPVSFQVQ